jgi:uncharacterized protein (DUF1330 family)
VRTDTVLASAFAVLSAPHAFGWDGPMTAYVIADLQVTDIAAYEPYRPLAAASIARFGGRFLVRGGPVELLDGELPPDRIVVIEFPDAETARRWYRSEEYQRARKIRQTASRGRLFLVKAGS